METFTNRIAVITGAGSGMGRELAVQLARNGAHVALCDISDEQLGETASLCRQAATSSEFVVSTTVADVSNETDLERFAAETTEAHQSDVVHLLFNNAGIGGSGSFVADDRGSWERTFDICWKGVYLGCRVFLPMMRNADAGHIVNTASVNGLWASLGTDRAHTSYSAAKFAVRGFTEALVTDLRLHAPHIGCSVVMPGHIGTSIVANSSAVHGLPPDAGVTEMANAFRNNAPTTAADAATIILDGVREGRWRILVGEDAHILDAMVREAPEQVYEKSFIDQIHAAGILQALVAE